METGDDLAGLLDIEDALDNVPDVNPKTIAKQEREATHTLRLVQLDYDPFVMNGDQDAGDETWQ